MLTDDEFAAEKARILSHRDSAEQAPEPLTSMTKPGKRRGLWIGGAIAVSVLLGGGIAYETTRDIAASRSTPRADGHVRAAKVTTSLPPLKPNASLDTAFTFASAAKCEPSGDLDRTIRAMQALGGSDSDGGSIALESLGASVNPQVRTVQPKADGPAAIVAEAQLEGNWQGLHVSSLRTITWNGSTLTEFQLRFRETASEAQTALKHAGFATAPLGKLRMAGDGTAVGVESIGEGSALTCARGYPPTRDDSEDVSDSSNDGGQPAAGPQGL